MKRQNNIFYFACILGITLCAANSALAAGRGAFAGDSVGARPSVFGEAFVAIADDANALRWNPAGLTKLLQPEVTSSHIDFFSFTGYFDASSNSTRSRGISEDFIGLVLPNHVAPVGVGFLNLGTSGMPEATQGGAVMNIPASYSERTFTLSSGKSFEAKGFDMAAGLNLNYLSLGGGSDAAGFGIDGGLLLDMPSILPEFGLMMRGLLMDTTLGDKGATVPAKTDVAMAFSPWRWLRLVGALSKTSGDPITQYSTGMELVTHWLSPIHISLQAGYKTLGGIEVVGIPSEADSWATGISMRISRYKFDYAYEEHSMFWATHRITFGVFRDSPESFHLQRGRQAFELLDDATAMREFEEVVYLAPRNVEVYHMLARTYERMRINDEAIRVLEKIQSLNYDYFIENGLDQLLKDIQAQE